ncbi:hypothetical protein BUALT_Bualt16G0082000 [Buddleja alternifolia]|uniref:DUF659 domain-containing protein n=1 Tax=Buddleja alternifolia TaxID=168488 RepID=A0AAV6WFE7_9LAMI|nr:hypothetical protein BUALT_Bualt16G0082000 [Buddleja alternifolia]
MSKLEEEATQRRDAKNKTPSLPCSMTSSSQSSYTMPNISNPYSLRTEGNPYFVRAFTFAANINIKGYVPPGYNALRTKLLDKEKGNTESQLKATRSTWRTRGVILVCDGWTDPQRRPLINFTAINENGPMFVHAVNCQGECKDKWFISHLIKEVIIEVDVANVVPVVTDNAPLCRAVGLLVEQTYPHIFWTPCVVHTLNLALKNICVAKNAEANEITYEECHWITQVVGSAVMIRNFIMNHSMRLSIFRLVKSQMQSMVISERWSDYLDGDVVKAILVKEKLLDEMWRDQVDYILSFTEPIYEMLRLCDTDQPSLHLVFEMCSTKEWQEEHPRLSPPQSDVEISNMRKLCFKRYFPNEDARRDATMELAKFIACLAKFGDADSLRDKLLMDPPGLESDICVDDDVPFDLDK